MASHTPTLIADAPPTKLPERHVTSNFIEHNGKWLLLKRSTKVKSYQEHWAVVSGEIEPNESPLQCATREIAEETSLKAGHDISFVRSGRPVHIDAMQEYKCQWVVHPFLWKLNVDPSNIKIDWEHTEFKFDGTLCFLSKPL